MNYNIIKVNLDQADSDIVLAMLMEIGPFDSFEEKEGYLEAYLKETALDEELKLRLDDLAAQFQFTYSIEQLESKNWNATWEANFQPVDVDQFCRIRASFHPADPKMKYDLVIDPKMAFGTGHHETTYMMVKMMQDLFWEGKTVFDYGSGTGVLSILASKMGAQLIDAVDIEEAAFENAIENTQLNNVFNVNVLKGDLSAIAGASYDIILANINRNVILQSLPDLHKQLNKRGTLLISGILKVDEPLIVEAVQKNNFTIDSRLEKGDWICIKLLN